MGRAHRVISQGRNAGRIQVRVVANAPAMILNAAHFISLLATVTISAGMGQAVHRDTASGIHPLFFTTPLSRASYLGPEA